MLKILKKHLRQVLDYYHLPVKAKSEYRKDRSGLSDIDPGPERVIDEGIAWLCRAQDNSITHDGGVARHFSLITGWSSSYPETTGYIIPTMLEYATMKNDQSIRQRAKRMLDWLVSIQFPEGGFQGGLIGQKPVVPVTFNTGQILLGLASGVREFGDEYYEPMCQAANWLVKTQDSDGCWRKYPTPFAVSGEKVYDTHIACGLFEAARIEPDKGYADAALFNIRWALKLQHDNGWFEKCCLKYPSKPVTHTLGYTLRGILEAYQFAKDFDLLQSCIKTADGLLKALRSEDGYLPGRMNSNWQSAVSWVCLTGSAQVAHCWLLLYQYTNDERYLNAASRTNKYVRRTVKTDDPLEIRGAIKGSFPINSEYEPYEYLNWACKFVIDSNMLEMKIEDET